MNIYIITINATADNQNITRPLLPEAYKTKSNAREVLRSYKKLYEPKEGYILKAETPDFFVFTVRTDGSNYTLTLAIEIIVINN